MSNHRMNARQTKSKRSHLRERDGDNCFLCGNIMVFGRTFEDGHPQDDCATLEHLHPVRAGGSNETENLALVHWRCNRLNVESRRAYAVRLLTDAGRYLMAEKDIWYDAVPNKHGQMVTGPHHQAVAILFRLASDLRAQPTPSQPTGGAE
jgi:hypothetical protein